MEKACVAVWSFLDVIDYSLCSPLAGVGSPAAASPPAGAYLSSLSEPSTFSVTFFES